MDNPINVFLVTEGIRRLSVFNLSHIQFSAHTVSILFSLKRLCAKLCLHWSLRFTYSSVEIIGNIASKNEKVSKCSGSSKSIKMAYCSQSSPSLWPGYIRITTVYNSTFLSCHTIKAFKFHNTFLLDMVHKTPLLCSLVCTLVFLLSDLYVIIPFFRYFTAFINIFH